MPAFAKSTPAPKTLAAVLKTRYPPKVKVDEVSDGSGSAFWRD